MQRSVDFCPHATPYGFHKRNVSDKTKIYSCNLIREHQHLKIFLWISPGARTQNHCPGNMYICVCLGTHYYSIGYSQPSAAWEKLRAGSQKSAIYIYLNDSSKNRSRFRSCGLEYGIKLIFRRKPLWILQKESLLTVSLKRRHQKPNYCQTGVFSVRC